MDRNSYLTCIFSILEPRYYRYLCYRYERLVSQAQDKEYAKVLHFLRHTLLHEMTFQAHPLNQELDHSRIPFPGFEKLAFQKKTGINLRCQLISSIIPGLTNY